jgi:hypothetical protein
MGCRSDESTALSPAGLHAAAATHFFKAPLNPILSGKHLELQTFHTLVMNKLVSHIYELLVAGYPSSKRDKDRMTDRQTLDGLVGH